MKTKYKTIYIRQEKHFLLTTQYPNEQVKRNHERFPSHFCFQLTIEEINELVANCDRFKKLKHSTSLPFAFTEQGVAMLAALLRSNIAIKISIQIMDAFVQMRQYLNESFK